MNREEPQRQVTDELAIRDLAIGDYDAVLKLWNSVPGVRANETREEFGRILARNPGLSCVAEVAGTLAAAVFCCHDGRRGYLYHLAVAEAFRRRGLGQRLVNRCLERLQADGIRRCTIFLIADNAAGELFWRQTGWRERTDLKAFARDL
jgi:ribosomal protein S18 acetylase RimI-like enzyme